MKRPDLAKRNRDRAIGFENLYKRGDEDECWPWVGALTADGYGHTITDGKTELAHRKAWRRKYGQSAGELHVLHKCDNPKCVNPKHLFLGTNQDNVDDKMAKGRHVAFCGEANGSAKLTESAIRNIRSDPRPNTVICREYGVSDVLISKIKRREIWRCV